MRGRAGHGLAAWVGCQCHRSQRCRRPVHCGVNMQEAFHALGPSVDGLAEAAVGALLRRAGELGVAGRPGWLAGAADAALAAAVCSLSEVRASFLGSGRGHQLYRRNRICLHKRLYLNLPTDHALCFLSVYYLLPRRYITRGRAWLALLATPVRTGLPLKTHCSLAGTSGQCTAGWAGAAQCRSSR